MFRAIFGPKTDPKAVAVIFRVGCFSVVVEVHGVMEDYLCFAEDVKARHHARVVVHACNSAKF